MKVLIVGAGAVGGYFGARLVRAGVDCVFLLRPRTLAAVKQKGLTVHSVDESFTVHPVASSDPRALPKASLVILSGKRYDLDEVIEQLRPVHFANATVLTLQNGVDAEERVLELVPNAQLVGGVAYIYARIAEPGVIEHYKRGSVAIGAWLQTAVPCPPQKEEPEIQSAPAKGPFAKLGEMLRQTDHVTPPVEPTPIGATLADIKALFDQASIPCQVVEDIRRTKWEKMCWNVAFNPLTVLLNDRVSKALAHPEMRAMIKPITEPAPLGSALLWIEGAVIQPLVFDLDALSKLPASDQVRDVSVEDPRVRGQGVRIRALLNVATCQIGADHVTFHSADGQYAASLHLKEAAESGILIYKLDGRPLRMEEGGPFRLITPSLGDWGASVKGLTRIEFTVGPGKDTRPAVL